MKKSPARSTRPVCNLFSGAALGGAMAFALLLQGCTQAQIHSIVTGLNFIEQLCLYETATDTIPIPALMTACAIDEALTPDVEKVLPLILKTQKAEKARLAVKRAASAAAPCPSSSAK